MTCTTCNGELEADALYCGHCGRRTRLRRASATGTIVDGTYRIDERLATGGFGTIYRATHLPSGTPVALKVLHADVATDPATAARFERESAALARLNNPHTVVTYACGEARDGTMYIAMELLHGESLQDRLRRGPLPWWQALQIMYAVCESLGEAHAQGIVHRDLKPANIFLAGKHAFAKVLDFGVAKVLPWSGVDDGSELTLVGETIGTVEYMAPEQLVGARCDARTDVYALGVVAYEMLTGRRPFPHARTTSSMIAALFTQHVATPSIHRGVPATVDALLLRCLARDPEDRYQSVGELAVAIDRALHRPPPAGPSLHAPLVR